MNKMIKTIISVVMSFAMVVCLAPTGAGAKEMSAKEDGISPASINIGVPYYVQDKYGKITFRFSSQSTLVVTYTDLTNKSRYIKMYVSTPSKSFPVRKFIVKANRAHSESYNINVAVSKVTVTIYRHTSSDSTSGQIDPIKGILQ